MGSEARNVRPSRRSQALLHHIQLDGKPARAHEAIWKPAVVAERRPARALSALTLHHERLENLPVNRAARSRRTDGQQMESLWLLLAIS